MDAGQLRAVAFKVVERMHYLFHRLPQWGREDLAQEGIAAVLAARKPWDPGRGVSEVTWVYRVVQYRLLDLLRSASASHAREVKMSKAEMVEGLNWDLLVDAWWESDQEIGEWCRQLLRAGRLVFERKSGRRGHPWEYSTGQVLAIVGLKRRLRCSCQGVVEYLDARPDVRRILRLHKVPTREWVRLADKWLAESLDVRLRLLISGGGGIEESKKSEGLSEERNAERRIQARSRKKEGRQRQ